MAGYAPMLPLQTPSENDSYQTITDMRALVRQNVKTLLFTAPGERIWDPQFGVGLRNFLFEFPTESIKTEIAQKVKKQFSRYMPFLNLRAVVKSEDPNFPERLKIEIKYFIKPLSAYEVLSLRANLLEKSISYYPEGGRAMAKETKSKFLTK